MGFGVHGHNSGTSEMCHLALTVNSLNHNYHSLYLQLLIITFAKLRVVKIPFFLVVNSVLFKSEILKQVKRAGN